MLQTISFLLPHLPFPYAWQAQFPLQNLTKEFFQFLLNTYEPGLPHFLFQSVKSPIHPLFFPRIPSPLLLETHHFVLSHQNLFQTWSVHRFFFLQDKKQSLLTVPVSVNPSERLLLSPEVPLHFSASLLSQADNSSGCQKSVLSCPK